MPATKAQQKAQNKWIEKTYDRINLTVPKGQKDVIKAHAEARGESVNGFIGRAIDETMERDNTASRAASEATSLHTREQAARRIISRHGMLFKKPRKGGGYIVEQEGGSQRFDTFEALLAFAESLDE